MTFVYFLRMMCAFCVSLRDACALAVSCGGLPRVFVAAARPPVVAPVADGVQFSVARHPADVAGAAGAAGAAVTAVTAAAAARYSDLGVV